METKLDSRQGQFPATFPDTFKDFFAMMSEDEDHLDIFSNLLEDKMIPRATKFNQRRCGGSLRCTSSSSHSSSNAAVTGGSGGNVGGNNSHNVGRSNSFRVNRTRATVASSNMGEEAATAAKSNISGSSSLVGGMGGGVGGVTASFCKHIKYCCLHQQQQHQLHSQSHHNSNQQLFQQQQHYSLQNVHDYGCSGNAATIATAKTTRLGPDGEDDNSCSQAAAALAAEASNGQMQQQHQQQTLKQQQQQKRHSIILERAFDFDVSCDESDTISTTSSTPTGNPTTSNIPYSILTRPPPILKQPHHSMQSQQQQQSMPIKEGHRTLPQPPRGVGFGAFHTKETALQRIQQQCGLIAGSKTNLAALGASSNNLAGATATASVVASNNYDNYNNISCSDGAAVVSSVGGWNAATGSGRNLSNLYMDLHSPTATPSPPPPAPLTTTTSGGVAATTTTAVGLGATQHLTTMNNKFNDLLSGSATTMSRNNLGSIRAQKSPILNRRRSSSIAANLLTADISFNRNSLSTAAGAEEDHGIHTHSHASISHSNTRDRLSHAKSPVGTKPNRIPIESGVLTFQQAMSGAVSPQYSATSPMHATGHDTSCIGSNITLAALLEGTAETTTQSATATTAIGASPTAESPVDKLYGINGYVGATGRNEIVGGGFLCGSSATIAQLGNKQRQRLRTSSMPAESRKPRLADTRRAAIHCADIDLDYYRLRSFSITSHGVCNLGDSLRRRSRSINSVTSTGTSNSGKDRHNSNASRTSGDIIFEQPDKRDASKAQIPAYKIAMLGASGVGKTTLTYQFTTSDYICAYDLSLDDDYGQKTVSVLVDGIETDLEIIDHPACEMSTEAFCSTYNIDLFVVVYSVVDRSSLKAAEKVLQYLKENEMLLTRGAILVGNKTDLERHREVNRHMGRKVAKEINCKFIETSSGLDHNVDELLVGIVAQVKLNPQRIRNMSERDRQRLNLQSTIQKHRRMHLPSRRMIRQVSMCQADAADGDDGEGYDDDDDGGDFDDMERDENQPHYNNINNNNNIMTLSSTGDECIGTGSERTASTSLSSSTRTSKGPIRKTNKRTLNLESILKMGESEIEDEEENAARQKPQQQQQQQKPQSKFELLTSAKNGGGGVGAGRVRTPFGSLNSSPKSRHSYESSSGGSGGQNRDSVRNVSGAAGGSRFRDPPSQAEDNLLPDCNRKTVSKLTNRTRMFLSSVLRFKKAINVKRRNSSSCSDLFVI